MIEMHLTCDACGRRTLATAQAEADWGHLRQTGSRDRDVCPRCIATAFGWQGGNGHVNGRALERHGA